MTNAARVKEEYDTDPLNLYSGVTTVAQFKTVLTTINRTKEAIVNMHEVAERIVDVDDFAALDATNKSSLETWYGLLREVDLNSLYLRNVLKRYFTSETATMANLKSRVDVNRLQELGLKMPTDHQLERILGIE